MNIPNQIEMQIMIVAINQLIENHKDEFEEIVQSISTKFTVDEDFLTKLENMNYWDVDRPDNKTAIINFIRFKVR